MMSCWASATPAETMLSAAAAAPTAATALDIRMKMPFGHGDPGYAPRTGRFPQPRSRKGFSEPTEVGNPSPGRASRGRALASAAQLAGVRRGRDVDLGVPA